MARPARGEARDVTPRRAAEEQARRLIREQEARRAAELAAERTGRLLALSTALSRALTADEVADAIVTHAVAALNAKVAVIRLLSPDGAELVSVRAFGYSPEVAERRRRIPADGTGLLAEAVRQRAPVVLETLGERLQRYPYMAEDRAEGADGAAVGLPLLVSERPIGALGLAFATDRRFSDEERAFMSLLAQQCAQAIDRSRLYEAEQAARVAAQAAESRYRGLFAGSADAIIVTDADGRLLDVNPAACALLGHTRDELLALNADTLAAQPALLVEQRARLQETRQWRGETEVRRQDGSTAPVESWVAVVDLPDGPVQLHVMRDITRRRAIERLQREFFAMIGHELKNPMTALRGYAQLMQRRPEYVQQATDAILVQLARLERIVDDLLDASRVELRQLSLQRARVDLVALARAAAEHAQAISPRHTIRVDAPDQPLQGEWDADRIAQVLHNVLSNAVKYSPAGGEITVELRDLGAEAQVAVHDQGIGIAPDILGRLFRRFYRGEAATAGGAKGLGVGLYISKALVEAHGGRMWAESAGPGQGSTFSFALPYQTPR